MQSYLKDSGFPFSIRGLWLTAEIEFLGLGHSKILS